MKNSKKLILIMLASGLLCGCVGREGSYGDTTYSGSKGLGMIAIEKYSQKSR